MNVNSSLADAVIAERRALDEWYASRNADRHTQLKKLGDWECARRQRQLALPDPVSASGARARRDRDRRTVDVGALAGGAMMGAPLAVAWMKAALGFVLGDVVARSPEGTDARES